MHQHRPDLRHEDPVPPRSTKLSRFAPRVGRQTGRSGTGPPDPITVALALVVLGLLVLAGNGTAPSTDAAPPPAGRFSHGAAGTARNGFGGEVAPSPTSASWPGTTAGNNGGPFAFIGAQYGSLWSIPPTINNSMGVGYCVMEDVAGAGTVARQPDPAGWDAGEMARAAALMATFGGDKVVPYGIDASGTYDVASGEWQHPSLYGGGEYTRRRHVAVGFGVKMFVEDVSPSGVIAGRKLARDTAIVNGTGSDFAALSNGYRMAQYMATVADIQHAVGGVRLEMHWETADGAAPTVAGAYGLAVRAVDSTGKPVGFVPVVQLSEDGIDANRSIGAIAAVDHSGDTDSDLARWDAAAATGWPTLDMAGSMAADPRFALGTNPAGVDVTDAEGVARFDVAISRPDWQLAFHTPAPTDDVDLYAGSGVQGQITWTGPPHSSSIHEIAPPVVGQFVIRKTLDAIDIQGSRDMSGFEFDVYVGGSKIATSTTLSDGRTPAIASVSADLHIVEVGRPRWAVGLADGGPVDVRFDPDAAVSPGAIEAEFVYTNRVPTPSITTRASDAADGDRYVDVDLPSPPSTSDPTPAAVIDTVMYRDLVPGTAYVARAELVVVGDGCNPTCATSATGATAFVPETTDGSIEVRIEISHDTASLAGLADGAVAVVFERIVVAASDRVVVEHIDEGDLDQTVYFPTLTTHLRRDGLDPLGVDGRSATVGDPVVDVVRYAGLLSGESYRIEMTLHERLAGGRCVPTGLGSSAEFEPTHAAGTIEVGGVRLPRAGVFVAFERLFADGVVVASHDDCNDPNQTLAASPPPAIETTTSTPAPTTTTAVIDTTTAPTTAPTSSTPATTATTTATTTPAIAPPPGPTALPRTGSDGVRDLAVAAVAMLMIGAGLILFTRSTRRA